MEGKKIQAARPDGESRFFTEAQWKALPKDKYGFRQIGEGDALPENSLVKKVAAPDFPELKQVGADAPNGNDTPDLKADLGANNNDQPNSEADANIEGSKTVVLDVHINTSNAEKEVDEQLALVKKLVSEGKNRDEIKAALGNVHWKIAQKLMDQVNSEADAKG